MGWKATCAMEERFRFVEDWKREEESVAELCRQYGVSRQTGYKWIGRYREGSLAALEDRSRAARTHPNQALQEVVDAVVGNRGDHPHWGPEKLRAFLQRKAPEVEWPSASTIGEILQRHGLVTPRKRRRRATPSTTPLAHATAANSVWCTDFKGWWVCGDGQPCYPLTLTDANSRFLLRCQGMPTEEGWRIQPIYEAAFREYGLPDWMRNDNGTPFASVGLAGLSWLSVWWIKLGIRPERIEPGKPSQNGRHERMHLTLQQEIEGTPAANLRVQQRMLDAFRHSYNEQRPHAALGQKTPAECYHGSIREYPSRIAKIEYPSEYEVRRVDPSGGFRWRGASIYATRALAGEWIGLEAIDEERWRVHFSFYGIGELSAGAKAVRVPKPSKSPPPRSSEKGPRNS